MALSDAEKYRRAQAAIRGQVHGAVNRLYAEAVRQELGPEAIRDLFLDRLPLLVERFGEDASAFAAEWYDELRSRHGSIAYYRAQMAPLTDGWQEMVEATTRRVAGQLWTDTPESMLPGVIDTADKIVGEAASQTIAHNARRDPDTPRYKVTLSPTACKYCRDVAREIERLGPGEQPARWFHGGGCRCTVTPTWANKDNHRPDFLSPLTREALTARGFDAADVASAKQAFDVGRLGSTVLIHADMSDEAASAFARVVDDVVSRAEPAIGRPVTVRVPRLEDDPWFGRVEAKAYTLPSDNAVRIHPALADGTGVARAEPGHLMAASGGVYTQQYAIAHELGHVRDNAHADSGRVGREKPDAVELHEAWKDQLSRYGASQPREGYAEAFAQWLQGGPGSSPVADAYAAHYGWGG